MFSGVGSGTGGGVSSDAASSSGLIGGIAGGAFIVVIVVAIAVFVWPRNRPARIAGKKRNGQAADRTVEVLSPAYGTGRGRHVNLGDGTSNSAGCAVPNNKHTAVTKLGNEQVRAIRIGYMGDRRQSRFYASPMATAVSGAISSATEAGDCDTWGRRPSMAAKRRQSTRPASSVKQPLAGQKARSAPLSPVVAQPAIHLAADACV